MRFVHFMFEQSNLNSGIYEMPPTRTKFLKIFKHLCKLDILLISCTSITLANIRRLKWMRETFFFSILMWKERNSRAHNIFRGKTNKRYQVWLKYSQRKCVRNEMVNGQIAAWLALFTATCGNESMRCHFLWRPF